ncbi:peroxiredoxin-like 2C [Clavelina lepadiformis]|uniref:peroxiredoxin-like 2C n=1 Tax=Clavelina lepadiformis TaxID=159417 RepID=UPI0040433800
MSHKVDDGEFTVEQPPLDENMERLPEKLFDLNEIDQCVVRGSNGAVKTFKELRSGYTCIIVFIRHFLDYVTKEYVEDFSKIFPRQLEENKVKLVVIGCGPSCFIQPFCEETNFPHEMYCDSKRIIHKVLRLHDTPSAALGATSPHVKSNFLQGFFQTFWRFVKSAVQQGDPLQQGGQIVINPGGQVLFFHRDLHPLDHTPINELLEAAKLSRIDFNTKYRIYDV